MNRVLTLLATTLLLIALLASTAMAQSSEVNLQEDAGDNVSGGVVLGDDSPDCANATGALETWCRSGAKLNADPGTLTNPSSASASASASTPATAQYAPASPTAGVTDLPATGGAPLLALGAGVLLVGGGLLARRMVR